MSTQVRKGTKEHKLHPQPFDLILQCTCNNHSPGSNLRDVKRLFHLLRQQGQALELDVINASGMTALTQCVLDGNLKSVQMLVQLGANVNKKDNQGWTAMHHAASEGYIDIARFLLKCGVDVRVMNYDGQTPLDLAETDELRALLNRVMLFYSPFEQALHKHASLPDWL